MSVRIVLSALVALAAFDSAGSAAVLTCEGVPLTVTASSQALAEQTCQAAMRTLPLLAQCGVVLSEPNAIDVRDEIPGSPNCMGVYHCGENKIEILAPHAIKGLRRDDSAFDALSLPIYFESILAHELAHAAYDSVPCPYPDCLLTSEYVGYAMQVYSLPLPDRKLFESEMDLKDRVSRDDISTIGLFLAPAKFARNVWAHFSQRADSCAYVADMMRADFYLDKERP